VLLAQVKWADLKDQMTLNQRVSGSSPERPTTTKAGTGPRESEIIGHYQILLADRRSPGALVEGGRLLVFAPLTPVCTGQRIRLPLARFFLASPEANTELSPRLESRAPDIRELCSIYLGADVLNHNQEAGCVEHPMHIRLSLNGARNFGRTTCFFHIRYPDHHWREAV
jgi:hypothetical protein